MPEKELVKKEILSQIDMLPDEKVSELLDFSRFLLYQQRIKKRCVPDREVPTVAEDPMDRFIGGIEHGSLARHVDKELYE